MEAEMLKAVVEQEHLHLKTLQETLGAPESIGGDDHRNPLQPLSHQVGLVSHDGRFLQNPLSVGDQKRRTVVAPAVTPADDPDAVSPLPPLLGQKNREGGFAGPADRQIPDAHHMAVDPPAGKEPFFIKEDARTANDPINERKRRYGKEDQISDPSPFFPDPF
jgi:hypothetical protein